MGKWHSLSDPCSQITNFYNRKSKLFFVLENCFCPTSTSVGVELYLQSQNQSRNKVFLLTSRYQLLYDWLQLSGWYSRTNFQAPAEPGKPPRSQLANKQGDDLLEWMLPKPFKPGAMLLWTEDCTQARKAEFYCKFFANFNSEQSSAQTRDHCFFSTLLAVSGLSGALSITVLSLPLPGCRCCPVQEAIPNREQPSGCLQWVKHKFTIPYEKGGFCHSLALRIK